MTNHKEVSIRPVDNAWYSRQATEFSYADRSLILRRNLPSVREFIVVLGRQNFVPIRHLIAQAVFENDSAINPSAEMVYGGVDARGLLTSGSLSPSDHLGYGDQDRSHVAPSSIDHSGQRELFPTIGLDPFIGFHIMKVPHPALVGYDTSKIHAGVRTVEDPRARWMSEESEEAATAINSIYYFPKRQS